MSAGWVAGVVRARALAGRRLGPGRCRIIAGSGSLAEALGLLGDSPYRKGVAPGQGVVAAQHGVAAVGLWQLRVLAGWLPREGVVRLRLAAAWFELANIDGLLQRLDGLAAEEPFGLGALETSWSVLADARDREDLRERLAASPWGDPGTGDPYTIRLFLRLSWARRAASVEPHAVPWASGAAATLVMGERFAAGRELSAGPREHALSLLGEQAVRAATAEEMTACLPREAAWALSGTDDPAEPWRSEARCWNRLEEDGTALLRGSRFDADPVLGAVVLLAADVWRVRAALVTAARGGTALEAYDALA